METIEAIRKSGMRATPQRIAITEYMKSSRQHPTAEQVHQAVRKRYPTVSLSTVYNTLDVLRDHSMIYEIERDAGSRYDWCDHAHLNMVCVECGIIEDLCVDQSAIAEIIGKRSGMTEYTELRGRCSRCTPDRHHK